MHYDPPTFKNGKFVLDREYYWKPRFSKLEIMNRRYEAFATGGYPIPFNFGKMDERKLNHSLLRFVGCTVSGGYSTLNLDYYYVSLEGIFERSHDGTYSLLATFGRRHDPIDPKYLEFLRI